MTLWNFMTDGYKKIYQKMKFPLVTLAIVILYVFCHEHHHEHQKNSHHHHHHQHFHNHQGHHHTEHQEQENSHITAQQPQKGQTSKQKLIDFFENCQKEIDEWVYIPKTKPLLNILQQCEVFSNAEHLIQFYNILAAFNQDFMKQHIDLMIRQFKKTRIVPYVLNCIIKQRQIQNHYLQERKKYKYLAQFIKRYPLQGTEAFPNHTNFKQIGKKTCHFFKALFEYYYLQVLNPSQTLSTEFLRALTVRSDVFEHEDIAFCIAIQSVGRLSGQLEQIDINNVYVKLPQICHALRFLKLKQKCRDEHHKKLINNLHTALEGFDMFKIMYKEYQPFVDIATQKMVQTQIRMLARKFAQMIANREQYLEYSKIKLDNDL